MKPPPPHGLPPLRRYVLVLRPGVLPPLDAPTPCFAALGPAGAPGVALRSVFRASVRQRLAKAGLALGAGRLAPDLLYLLVGPDPQRTFLVVQALWQRGDLLAAWPEPPRPRRLLGRDPLPGTELSGPDLAEPCVGPDPMEPVQGYRHRDADGTPPGGAGIPHWGVGATAVDPHPWGRGAGVRLRIVERGWYLRDTEATCEGCPDLAVTAAHLHATPQLDIAGGSSTTLADLEGDHKDWRDHGLRDLCITSAIRQNCREICGLAPDAQVALHPTWTPDPFTGKLDHPDVTLGPAATDCIDLYNGLAEVVLAAQPGDVVLVEDQVLAWGKAASTGPDTLAPLEVDPLCLLLLGLLTTGKRATVIEPAGNGSSRVEDLAWPLCAPDTLLAAEHRPLMVGGVDPGTRCRTASSNHGARVELFAWGDRIRTIRYNALLRVFESEGDFGGTSGASAIVAGCAAAAQSMAVAAGYGLLDPGDLRALLQHGASPVGAGCAPLGKAGIGVMLDLTAIAQHLGLI